jgi:hypothetical protein
MHIRILLLFKTGTKNYYGFRNLTEELHVCTPTAVAAGGEKCAWMDAWGLNPHTPRSH